MYFWHPVGMGRGQKQIQKGFHNVTRFIETFVYEVYFVIKGCTAVKLNQVSKQYGSVQQFLHVL